LRAKPFDRKDCQGFAKFAMEAQIKIGRCSIVGKSNFPGRFTIKVFKSVGSSVLVKKVYTVFPKALAVREKEMLWKR
jgi:hypothetical protein